MNSYCSFCASAGVKGPHDHFLRASKDVGAPICCPKLLATECNYCHRKGHTIKFCGAKREQQMLASQARARANAAKMKNGEWMTATGSAPSVRAPAVLPVLPTAKITGMFAALEMEDPSSSDDEDECMGCESGVDCAQAHTCTEATTTWAQVVREGKSKVEDEDDEELPPLIFGRRAMTRWGDED